MIMACIITIDGRIFHVMDSKKLVCDGEPSEQDDTQFWGERFLLSTVHDENDDRLNNVDDLASVLR